MKDKFLGYNEQKEAFPELRDGICVIVKSCADNIRLVIYIDEVLDQPITVVVGKEQASYYHQEGWESYFLLDERKLGQHL